jgi:DNA-binding response OmpR family regulator
MPALILAAAVPEDDTRRFLEACGQPAVLKPYEFAELIAAIGKVAGHA